MSGTTIEITQFPNVILENKKRGNYTSLLVPQVEAFALPIIVERANADPTHIVTPTLHSIQNIECKV